MSVATDQRMNIWHVDQGIVLYHSCMIHVADVSTLELIRYAYTVTERCCYFNAFITGTLQSIVLWLYVGWACSVVCLLMCFHNN